MTSEDNSTNKRSSSPSGRDNKRRKGFMSSEGHNVNSKELFVSNLHFETTWQDFRDTVKDVVGEDPYVQLYSNEHGKPRGCGIIRFKTSESAKSALDKMQGYELKGRKIKVNESFDEPRDKHGYLINSKGLRRKDSDKRGMINNMGGISPGYSSLNTPQQFPKDEYYGLNPQFLASIGIKDGLTNRIWVSNLDDERVDEKKLLDVFRLAGSVVVVILSRTREGKSKGHAIIEYRHPLEAVQAITYLNNSQLYGKRMYVRLDRVGERSNNQYPNRFPDGLEGCGMGLGMNGQIMQNISEKFSQSDLGMSSNGGSAESVNRMVEEMRKKYEEQAKLQEQLKMIAFSNYSKQLLQKSSSTLPQLGSSNMTKDEEEEKLNNMGVTREQMMEFIKAKSMSFSKEETFKQQTNPSASFLWERSMTKDNEPTTGSSRSQFSSNFDFMTPGNKWM